MRTALDVRAGRVRQQLRPGSVADAPIPGAARSLTDVITEAFINVVVRDSATLAVRLLDDALRTRPIQILPDITRPYFDVASTYALAGRPDRARDMLNQFTRDVTDTALKRVTEPRYQIALGEVLLAEKKFPEALTAFRRGDSLPDGPAVACTICLSHALARVFEAAGQTDSAIVMYEHFITTPFWNRMEADFDGTWLAQTHLRLARLYEGKGDNEKAVAHYQQFVDLWKNADAELQPRVSAARQRLTVLRRK
jgi:tetratricopeptide (TPR) repeat protein